MGQLPRYGGRAGPLTAVSGPGLGLLFYKLFYCVGGLFDDELRGGAVGAGYYVNAGVEG